VYNIFNRRCCSGTVCFTSSSQHVLDQSDLLPLEENVISNLFFYIVVFENFFVLSHSTLFFSSRTAICVKPEMMRRAMTIEESFLITNYQSRMSTSDVSPSINVDLTRSTGGVWLVKMPKYLSQILNDHADETINGEVGRLIQPPSSAKGSTSTVAGARSQDVVFRLNDEIMKKLKEKNPSKDYKLPPREHRFCLSNISDGVLRTIYNRKKNNSNSSTGEQISLVGKVIKRADVRPVESEEYMSMKRKHFEISQEPARKAQIISKKVNPYAPKRDHAENKKNYWENVYEVMKIQYLMLCLKRLQKINIYQCHHLKQSQSNRKIIYNNL
jgi:hypothetical protein